MNSIDSIPRSTAVIESDHQSGADPQLSDPAVLTALRNLMQDPKSRLQALKLVAERKTKELTAETIKIEQKSAQVPKDKLEAELQVNDEEASAQQASSGQHFVLSFSPTGLPVSPKSVGNGAIDEAPIANVTPGLVDPALLPTKGDLKDVVAFLKAIETSLSKKETAASSEGNTEVEPLSISHAELKIPVAFKPAAPVEVHATASANVTKDLPADAVETILSDVLNLLDSIDPEVSIPQPRVEVSDGNVTVDSESSAVKMPTLEAFFSREIEKGSTPEELDVKLEEAVVFLKALVGSGAASEKPAPTAAVSNVPQALPVTDVDLDANVALPAVTSDDQIDVKLQKAIMFLESARTAIASGTFTEKVAVQEPVAQAPESSVGASILQFLNQQSSQVSTPLVTQTSDDVAVNVADRVGQIETLMTEMAERVLVTDPLHGQTPEVRIKLAESILPGTEVRVWRGDGGQVNVTFHTTSPESAKVLADATDALAQRLNERMPTGEPALVSIETSNESPNDGRSRQRFNPWDIMNNEDDKG